ncbi:MAG TPA: hypothetical protein VGG64_29870 [Pirellulales bacterium]|jgi:hypothetical protein
MSTIANIAVRLTADNSPFVKVMAGSVLVAERAASAVVRNNAVVKSATAGWTAANGAAGGYLKTIIGVAGASTLVARSVKSFASAQSAGMMSNAGSAGAVTLAASYKSVTDSVDHMYASFGRGLARTANFNATAGILNSVLQKAASFFNLLGGIAGRAFNFIANYPPVFLAAVVAVKAFAAVVGILVHVLLVRLIVQTATWLVFGTAMTPITLAWAAAKLVLTAAVWACTAALGALAAIGLPIWAGIGAAIAIVAGITYGLVKAWQWLTTGSEQLSQIAQMQKVHEATQAATKGIFDYVEALEEANKTDAMSDSEKKKYEFAKMLDKAQEDVQKAGGKFDRGHWEQQLQAQLDIADAAEKRKNITEAIADLEKELAQSGMTQAEKMASKIASLGGTAEDRERAGILAAQIDQRQKMAEMAKEIADIEREASFAGLTAIEKRVALLREAGATEEQIAAVQARLQAADAQTKAAEERKKLEEELARLQKDAAEAFMTDAEKRIDMLKRMGATQSQIDKAQADARRIEGAKQAKEVVDSVRTPLENLTKRMRELRKLHSEGFISQQVFDRALRSEELKVRKDLAGRGKTAEQGGAIVRGSQADIAARFGDRGGLKTNEEILRTEKQSLDVLRSIQGSLDSPPTPEVVNLN